MRLVALRRREGELRVLPWLERGSSKEAYTEPFTKRFPRYGPDHGLYDPQRNFHSFRTTFIWPPPYHRDHVRSYDFVEDRAHDERKFRMLNVINDYACKCLMIRVDRKGRSTDVVHSLADLFILRSVPGYLRSATRPEFIAKRYGTRSPPSPRQRPSS